MSYKEIYCRGMSMYPTLKPGDLLLVDPTATPSIGDILVFDNTLGDRYVHRFVSKENNLIKTRGDNNKSIDMFDTVPTGVVGVVTGVKKGNRVQSVSRGLIGRLVGAYRHIIKCHRWIFIQPCLWILHSYPIRLLLQNFGDRALKGKISLFKRSSQTIKLCYKNTTMGKYDLSQKAFEIRPVMRPFFSEEHLQSIEKRVEKLF